METNEDSEIREVIARHNERTSIEQITVNGKSMIALHEQSLHLYEIEKFVRSIENDDALGLGFAKRVSKYNGAVRLRRLPHGRKYDRINVWVNKHSDLYRYSERVEVFYDVCKELGMFDVNPLRFPTLGPVRNIASDVDKAYAAIFNCLVQKIRVRCESREFKERERLRCVNTKRCEKSVLKKEKQLFEECKSRWIVIVLTLAYETEFLDQITLEMIQEHRNKFLAARKNAANELMSGIKWYVWGIEQGPDVGLHLHVVLFYDVDHKLSIGPKSDEILGRLMCKFWSNEVTQGKGNAWSSNEDNLKWFYDKRGHGNGVGMIDWRDEKKRTSLRENLLYPAKAGQYLMIRGAEAIRTFGMGRLPKKKKQGRTRTLHARHASAKLRKHENLNEDCVSI